MINYSCKEKQSTSRKDAGKRFKEEKQK
jgi:hypothetical protein